MIAFKRIHKKYRMEVIELSILKGIDLDILAGKSVAIMGLSAPVTKQPPTLVVGCLVTLS